MKNMRDTIPRQQNNYTKTLGKYLHPKGLHHSHQINKEGISYEWGELLYPGSFEGICAMLNKGKKKTKKSLTFCLDHIPSIWSRG